MTRFLADSSRAPTYSFFKRVWLSLARVLCCAVIVVLVGDLVVQTGSAEAAGNLSSTDSTSAQTMSELSGVSCPTRSFCVAAGYSFGTQGIATLIETWNGSTWSIVASPNNGSGDFLSGVSCSSSTSCIAVGGAELTSGVVATLVEAWNGTNWTIVASPNNGSFGSQLYGVSCLNSTDCIAVGDYANAATEAQTLIESWNGMTWTITPSPTQGTTILNSVACVSPSDCLAAGGSLIEVWNGTTWSITQIQEPGSGNFFSGVSCLSSVNCTAVGQYSISGGAPAPLVESWNGRVWSFVASPAPGSGGQLLGVSCTSSTRCMAVGEDQENRLLTARWNGTAWSVTRAAKPGTDDVLVSVSCATSNRCIAVGNYSTASTKFTLIEQWKNQKTRWVRLSSPNAS